MKTILVTALLLGFWGSAAMADNNRIDLIRPDAPELAAHGEHPIGVRTLEATNPDQIDILRVTEGEELPRYDRPLVLEIWYPAASGTTGEGEYQVYLRDGETQATLRGRGVRDAEPSAEGPFPLVIISHGYPGNRFLLSHLAENLATKGYVVAAIDHTDSTYSDQAAFGSTLVNRSLDQLFVLDEMARLGAENGHFLEGLVDAANTGLIGYSMGGYGAVITAGGGVTQASTEFAWGAPRNTLAVHLAGSEEHAARVEERIKAVVAVAPWGMNTGFWDADGLAGISTPIFYVAGSVDDVSGYENGVKAIYEQTVNAERYLLTFENANHNAAAPIPAPVESWAYSEKLGWTPFDHYADPVWDSVRMNNIAQHFVTAFLGLHLKDDAAMAEYLDLIENAGEGVFALEENGVPKPEHTYWKGFADRTAKGLSLLSGMPGDEQQ